MEGLKELFFASEQKASHPGFGINEDLKGLMSSSNDLIDMVNGADHGDEMEDETDEDGREHGREH